MERVQRYLNKRQEKKTQQKGPKQRAQWASQREFMLTCIGYAVGLGNVWRFPYLCYKSGGGAFLIPYLVMMCLIGFPLLYMEYCFGQYFGVGSISIWGVCPMLKGIGIGYCVVNALVSIYYNVIIALSLYYLFASFQAVLPWSNCNNEWNTDNCDERVAANLGGNATTMVMNGTTTASYAIYNNITQAFNTTASTAKRVSPSSEYWHRMLLDQGDHDITDIGQLRWHLTLCLLLAWVFVVIFLFKGIKTSGKVVYFTATFPYVMLTVLVIRGATLEGASEGLYYFITPDWDKLTSPDVWFDAATQLFYSTNIAWGGMITMASYNSFRHNCMRDAFVINIVAYGTSLYAGVAVFSVIGYMSVKSGVPVKEVIDSGPGLAFIVYPRALGLMPLAPLWSVLFFFMLFLLGIGSEIVSLETVRTSICDEFAFFGRRRKMTMFGLAIIFFLAGLPCVTQGGMYVLNLMDRYAAGFSLLVIAVMECLGLMWFYKIERFCSHIKEMLGFYPHIWWRVFWQFISPILIVVILVFTFVRYKPVTYGDEPYPVWADALGWIMSLSSTIPIFVVIVYMLWKSNGTTLREKFQTAITPEKGMLESRDRDAVPEKEDSGNGSEESLELVQGVASTDILVTSENHHHGNHDRHRHLSKEERKGASPETTTRLLNENEEQTEIDNQV